MEIKSIAKIGASVAAAGAVAGGIKVGADIKNKKFCPVCTVKKAAKKLRLSQTAVGEYNNGVALTPPMGWSSWNLFGTNISEDLIKEIAVATEKSGLRDAGYIYINIDDCWQASARDEEGKIQCDKQTFPSGIKALSTFMNDRGMKLGLYSSNGYFTCEDYPASLRKERFDADSLAEWGVEYFKYDFCHNVAISTTAPKIIFVELADSKGNVIKALKPSELTLSKNARVVPDDTRKSPSNEYIGGLSSNNGMASFDVTVEAAGTYVLTLSVIKECGEERFIMADTGAEQYHMYSIGSRMQNGFRRIQQEIQLTEGTNTIKLYNPVGSKFDSSAIQYKLMGKELKRATKEYAEKTGTEEKPIVYSICEWGVNRPYKWGREAGNLWRTTPDIRATWPSILGIYEHNVKLWKYASRGAWNDPDMLEVGNGKLTYDENCAHFSLWCMMCAPLILGNDIRAFILPDGTVDESNKTLQILKNKEMIAINQDALGVQARRLKAGLVDVLAKPLEGGSVALCFFNKTSANASYKFSLDKLANEGFLNLESKASYEVYNVWEQTTDSNASKLEGSLKPHSVKVFIIK